jgi:glutamate/tyrosine decarboxylase-like PLP-dependent enzyme
VTDDGGRLIDRFIEDRPPAPPFPRRGRSVDETLAALEARRAGDVDWHRGRMFGLVHDGGPEVTEVAERAALAYLHPNALDPRAFPSVAELQHDLVGWTAELLHGPAPTAGAVTSGGTESILCAALVARQRARDERGVAHGSIVVPASAHPAFFKAGFVLDMPVVVTPVTDGYTADVAAMAAAVDDRTALVVGSAPQFPQGVVDPIPEIAALAASVGAHCHVDACMGGHVLPFAEALGRDVPAWDFRVPGVDSISADNHKLGYAPKGVGVVVYRADGLRRRQSWDMTWPGGYYASVGIQGSRSAAPMAAAWAVMTHLGFDGFVRLVDVVLANADLVRTAVADVDGLRVLGDPALHLLAFAADPASGRAVDVHALARALRRRGWVHDVQDHPPSIHTTVSNTNTGAVADYPADLRAAVDEVLAGGT